MNRRSQGTLTPYLKNNYEKILKLKQENPDKSLRSILKQLGTSYDSFLKAKRLIASGAIVTEAKRGGRVTPRRRLAPKQPTMVSVPMESISSSKPLIALIGTREDILRSLNSLFN